MIIAVCLMCVAAWLGGAAPTPYCRRTCQGRGWRKTFPEASKQQIREFLGLFAQAFAFRHAGQLQFRPDDTLLQIYRTVHPGRRIPDALELDTLACNLKRRYALDLGALWNEHLTLGELFGRSLAARASAR
ncbi:putative uncharacterized protein [Janthinobacterium agaricidamnosum NBRC 102515 = DSM 9628]|uniref:Uncharacterized protein n=2 Tax=Janthinobacterium agaricidamnosum TaxID=55508 RepID=W0VB35_9BURK|nr:putative uncharacterized protein [Janthinobacterium agaricidamnosum NBRC 102515 = DSM 9628]